MSNPTETMARARKAAHRKNETRRAVKPAPEFEPSDARLERLHTQGAVPRAMRTLPKR